ncbi:MAG: PEP-CTERM sorting domain-containing protein [Gemmatirosa sp.]
MQPHTPDPRVHAGRASPLGLLAAAVLLLPAAAAAQGTPPPSLPACPAIPATETPFLGILIGGECVDLTRTIRRADTPAPIWIAEIDEVFGVTRVQLNATFDADPFISFGATTTNLGAGPTTFAFLFGTPIVPGLYNTATSSGGVSVTAGATGSVTVANSGIYPSFISGYGTVGSVPTNLGVDIGTTPCTSTTTTTCTYGPGSATFAPTFYNNMELLLTYTQSGGPGSIAAWSGRVDLLNQNVVPEPATVALLATGLLVVGGVARRRMR